MYSGSNDTPFTPERKTTLWDQVIGPVDHYLRPRLLLWHVIAEGLKKPAFYTYSLIDKTATRRAETFIRNMERLHAWCDDAGARLAIITQQHTALHAVGRPADLERLTYEAECADTLARLERDGGTSYCNEAYLMVHRRITDAVRDWAARKNVDLVEGIRALDQDRNLLESWVHLAEPANAMLARATARSICGAARQCARVNDGGGGAATP